MKKRLVYRNTVNWGWLIYTVSILVLVITLIYLYYFINLLLFIIRTPTLQKLIILVITSVPIILLNIFLIPVMKTLVGKFFKKSELKLYTTGIKIKKNFLTWKKIKSISFQTGRLQGKKAFFRGFQLPIIQKIFILDKKGKEYSCIIDVDYYLKKNREKNNLRKIRDLLLGLDKLSLLSDWAEKR